VKEKTFPRFSGPTYFIDIFRKICATFSINKKQKDEQEYATDAWQEQKRQVKVLIHHEKLTKELRAFLESEIEYTKIDGMEDEVLPIE
jgi:hypothetical protein